MSSEEWDTNIESAEFEKETESILEKSETNLDNHISKIQSSIDETDKLMKNFDDSTSDDSAEMGKAKENDKKLENIAYETFDTSELEKQMEKVQGLKAVKREVQDIPEEIKAEVKQAVKLFDKSEFQKQIENVAEASKPIQKRQAPAMPEAINIEIQNAVQAIGQLTTEIPQSTIPTVVSLSWWEKLKQAASRAENAISNTYQKVANWTTNAAKIAKVWTTNTTKKAINATKNGWKKAKNFTENALNKTINATTNGWNSVKNMTKNGVKKLVNATKNGWVKTKNMTSQAWNQTKNDFGKLKNVSKAGLAKAKNWTVGELDKALNSTKNGIGKIKNATKGEVLKLKNATLNGLASAKNWTTNEMNIVKNSTVVGKVTNATKSAWNKVKGWASGAINQTKNEVNKLKNSTQNALGKLKNSTQNGLKKLANLTKNGLSKVKNLTSELISSKVGVNSMSSMNNDAQKFQEFLQNETQPLKAKMENMAIQQSNVIPAVKNRLQEVFSRPNDLEINDLQNNDFQNQFDNTIAKAQEQISKIETVIKTRSVTVGSELSEIRVPDLSIAIGQATAELNQKLSETNGNSVFGSIGPKVDPNGVNVMVDGIGAVDPQLMDNMMEAARTLSLTLMNFTQKTAAQLAQDGTLGNVSQQEFKEMLIATQQSFQQLTEMLKNSTGSDSRVAQMAPVMHDIPSVTIPSQLEATLNNLSSNAAQAVVAQNLDTALQQTAAFTGNVTDPAFLSIIDNAKAAIQIQLDTLQALDTLPTTTPIVGNPVTTTIVNPATNAASVPATAATTTLANPAVTTNLANSVTTTVVANPTGAATTTTVANLGTNAATTTTVAAPATGTNAATTTASPVAAVNTTVNPATGAATTTTTTLLPGPTTPAVSTTTTLPRTQNPGDLVAVPDFPPAGCMVPSVDIHSKVSQSAYQEMGISDDCEGLCANMTMFPCQAYTWGGPGTYCVLHGPIDKGMVTIQSGSIYNITDYLCEKGSNPASLLKLCVFAERGIRVSVDLNVSSFKKYKAQTIQFCQQWCSLDTLDRCTSFAFDETTSFFDGYNCVTFHRSLSLTSLPRGTFELYENQCLLYQ
ncbi:unnamed protein product, partial [Mesorhabditis belari]|uniref:Apple domain-containing protein n=1 Tax=Mesorhabditis belari TaxID=2138241 RepID=A0AAF3FKS9_9BILA